MDQQAVDQEQAFNAAAEEYSLQQLLLQQVPAAALRHRHDILDDVSRRGLDDRSDLLHCCNSISIFTSYCFGRSIEFRLLRFTN